MKTKKAWVILAAVVLVCVVIVYNIFNYMNSPQRKFERNLKSVAEYVFTMPDKYFSDIVLAIDEKGLAAQELDLPDITTGIDENVKQYFTEESYERFKGGWSTFSNFCVGTEYTTTVKSFKTEDYSGGQTKFTATLSYGKPNEEAIELVVWGRARSDSKGKIEYWGLMENPANALMKMGE